MRLPAPHLHRQWLRGLAVLLFAFAVVLVVTGTGGSPARADDNSAVPAEPTELQIETTSGSLDVSLDWDDVDGAGRYRVRWRTVDTGEALNEGVEVESSETDITVAGYGEWEVQVQACNDGGCSEPLTQQFTVEPAPTPTPEPTATPTPEPTATPLPLQVSITAQDQTTSLQTGDAVKLQAVITNGPSDETPSYQWELYLDGNWRSMSRSPDFSVTTNSPGPVQFRVTVSYASGASATSDPVTITWLKPTPTPEPTPTPTPEPTATPLPLQVSITALGQTSSLQTGDAVKLQAVVTNAPPNETPSYQWELYLDDSWQSSLSEGSANFSLAVGSPGPVQFRVTVSYASGSSATSDPVTATWIEPTPEPTATPTPEPTATPTPEPTATPLPLQVSITALGQTSSLQTGDAVKLQAVVTNAPPNETPSYQWELYLDDSWQSSLSEGSANFSLAVGSPGPVQFRVTVSYASGSSATSDPVTVTWIEPTPTPEPTATPTPEPTATPTPEPTATPLPLQVSITAQDQTSSLQTGDAVKLQAVVTNAPPNETPSYQWELYLDGSWQPSLSEGSANFSLAVGSPGPVQFRVTVSYASGSSATSDPITITWIEPTPTPEPTATPTPEPTATPLSWQVSITARGQTTSLQTGDTVELQAVITNAPSDETPSYQWEHYLDGSWQSSLSEDSANFSLAVDSPGSVEFRVTVSYASGSSATSDPVTVTWIEPTPTPTPEPTATLGPTPTPTPSSLWVSITASPANPQPGEAAKLQAVISNPPSGNTPSYQWEMELGDSWHVMGRNATFGYLVNDSLTQAFRVTVTFDTGDAATSDPINVTWGELPPTPVPTPTPTPEPTPTPTPVPNQAPTVNAQAENYSSFINRDNAPRGQSVTKPFHGVFSDPDGDELTYTVSIPADHQSLVQEFGIPTEEQLAQSGDPIEAAMQVFFEADADDDWNALVPALPDPLTTTVTLTATDPDGLSASVQGAFLTDWESHPALLSATASPETVKLTFNQAVQESPGPTAGQFTVNVTNGDGSTGTIAVKSVTVSDAVITLELDSALVDGQTVTLDYAHDDDTPLKRAAEGGDHTPGFTGQAVELSNPPGPPTFFAVSTTPGELALSATWDAVDGATSYKLSWRLADGNFDPENESTVSETSATITVSGYGQWVVQLAGCNDAGCGPAVAQTVAVMSPAQFGLSPAMTDDGKLRPRTVNAFWDPVPNAAAYGLRWWKTGLNAQAQAQAQTQAQGGPAPRSPRNGNQGANAQAQGGPGGNGNQGANTQGERTFPSDQTNTEVTVSEDGLYEFEFEALDNNNRVITSHHTNIQVWVSGGLNATLFPMFDCRAQSRRITDIEVTFSDGSVRMSWDNPGISSITKYQYMLIQGGGFDVTRGVWRDVPRSNAGTTSHTVSGLANERTYGILLQAVAGNRIYCFESLAFVTLFDISIPLITGFDAWKTWDDGAQQVTLFWDNPGDDSLTYEYWYEGVPAHWSGFRGTPGWTTISGTPPSRWLEGTLYTTLSGLPCEYYYYHFWIRPRRGNALGPVVRTNYVYISDHVYPGESTLTGDREHECLSGWGGNDKVYGNRGNDILKGHGGNDQLYGGPGNDQLDGGNGDDRLEGGNGDDRLEGGPGADHLDGGPGTDTVYYSGPYASVDLTIAANGTYTASGGHGEGDTLVNVERFAGLAIALFLVGDEGDNVLQGHEGDDTLTGLGGNDFLIGSPGSDTLDGGDGTDTADYAGSTAAVTVNLNTGTHSGGYAQGDTLVSIENLIGSAHGDSLTGDANANNIRGGDGCDTLNGGAGDDTLIGDDGCDTLNGNDGNDMLFGNDGVDTLNGNDGDDHLDGGPGNDALDGGNGTDTASYADSNAGVAVSLTSGTGSGGHAQGDTLTLIENLTGSSYADSLIGRAGANSLSGGAGNDTLIGRAGADPLDGGDGTDTASYAGAPAAVTVNLNTGTHTGEAQGDTFTSIEIISGSDNDDTLTGNNNANHLKGAAGNDILIGLGGADTLDGGAGNGDTASYAGSNAGVTVSLTSGSGSGGHAQGDTLTLIENLTGSSHDDTLTGRVGANSLKGAAGNDILIGRAGADPLDGGAGTDTASYAGAPAAVTVNLNTGTHTGRGPGRHLHRASKSSAAPTTTTPSPATTTPTTSRALAATTPSSASTAPTP